MLSHFILGVALVIGAILARPQSALSVKDIQEAIELGLSGEPEPYGLRHVPGGVEPNPVIVGVVYTPFIRVALAARKAREEGKAFTSDDVSPRLVEPLVYIAMRWYCCDNALPELFGAARPAAGAMSRDNPTNERRLMPPAWVTDDLSVLRSLHGSQPLPFEDIVLVMAFPAGFLSGEYDFVIRKEVQNPTGGTLRSVRRSRLVMEEIALWR